MSEEVKTENETIDEVELQRYEIVYLISNKLSEDELEPITNSMLKLIEDNNGKVIKEDNWGKRKLAYPIDHLYHAYYIIVECDLDPATVQILEKHLRLHEDIIRYIIVSKRVKTEEELKHEKVAATQRAKEGIERKAMYEAANKKEGLKTRRIPETKIEKKVEEKKEEVKKVDEKELDKKLDSILDNTEDLIK